MAFRAVPAVRLALRRSGASAFTPASAFHAPRDVALRLAPAGVQLQLRWGHAGKASLEDDKPAFVHFRESKLPHPLKAKPFEKLMEKRAEMMKPKDPTHMEKDEKGIVDLMHHHIWSAHEIDERMGNLYQHRPQNLSDRAMHGIMYALYRGFNWITGFQPQNTPVRAVEWRLIVLESFAGVPGFMAAMFRHFRSLRTLQRDHGWIHTLLEEAENERMHLLVCMKMFKASYITRLLVVSAQVFMTPWLAMLYSVHPRSVHRFVGYLEETACLTYANIIRQVETPGTPLHQAWAHLPAPALAKAYWRLPEDALWVDALKCMFADETNHRDVNHTFATMRSDDPNPFLEEHASDAVHAWRLQDHGQSVDIGCSDTLGTKDPPRPQAATK